MVTGLDVDNGEIVDVRGDPVSEDRLPETGGAGGGRGTILF